GVGKANERADQSGQRHELKQLIGRVMKAGLRQFGCDDAPDELDRKTKMLGDNRPDEITLGNEFTRGFPERLILRVPFRNPARVAFAHQGVPFRWGQARVNRSQRTASPGARKRFSQGGGVACSVRDKTHGASSGDGVASALQAPCQPTARGQSASKINQINRLVESQRRELKVKSALRKAPCKNFVQCKIQRWSVGLKSRSLTIISTAPQP